MRKSLWKKTMAFVTAICVVMGLVGVSGSAHAAEAETDAVDLGYVDISDSIIQNGGFLSEEEEADPYGIAMVSRTYSNTKVRDYLEKTLASGYDSFAKTIYFDYNTYSISISDIKNALEELLNHNYQYYYVYGGFTPYGTSESRVHYIDVGYVLSESAAKSGISQMEAAINEFAAGADSSWSDLEKALYINDYLATHCEYSESSSNAYNAYGALVEKKAVCQGYAIAFQAFADRLGLTSELVSSINLNHIWNIVKVGSSYYHVDVTWNDPTPDVSGAAMHNYFLKSTNYFRYSGNIPHWTTDWVIDGSGVTESSAGSTKYDSYFWDDVAVAFEFLSGNTWCVENDGEAYLYTCDRSALTFSAVETETISDGFFQMGSIWCYAEDGELLSEGLVEDTDGVVGAKGTLYYVKNGAVGGNNYTGFAKNAKGWWYVEKGKVSFNKNSVIKDSVGRIGSAGDWWYVVGGKVQSSFTGLANYSNSNGWWYIKNGKVDFSHNGVDKNKNGWWYVVGGKVQLGYTGVANYSNSNGWWYIKNGKVDFSANTVAKNKNGWWYVSGGKVQFGFNGIAQNANGWWYIKDGKVQFNYSGNVKAGGVTYKVVNGKVKR